MTAVAEKRSEKGVIKGTGTRLDLRTKCPKNIMPAYNTAATQKQQIIVINANCGPQKRVLVSRNLTYIKK